MPITILALDKWQSVSRHARITNTSSMKVISFGIWSAGLLFALLILLFSDTIPVEITDTPTTHHTSPLTVCRLDFFSFAAAPNVWLASAFNLILLLAFMCILFVLPLVIATASHSKTYLHLLKGSQYSHVHDLSKRIRASDKEAVRMLTFALVIFALCWLPWHVLQTGWFTSSLFQKTHSGSISEWGAQLWSVAFFLARQAILLSTILMPLAYLVFGHSIRKQFLCHAYTLLRILCPFLNKYPPGPFGPNGSQSSQSSTSSTNSSLTTTNAIVGAEVKKNSLQKLLPGSTTSAVVSMSPNTSMA